MAQLYKNLYQEIMQFCTQNPASRSFIQEFVTRGIGDHICAAQADFGCLVRSSAHTLYVCAISSQAPQEFIDEIIEALIADEQLMRTSYAAGAHESSYRLELCVYSDVATKDRLRKLFALRDYCSVKNVSYLSPHPPAYTLSDTLSISRLDESYLDCVCEHYTKISNREYLRSCLKDRFCYGIFEREKLAGFIGEHAEGTLGLLEIFPEFRRKGYAFILEAYAIKQQLLRGQLPVAHIVLDNSASFALQDKLGMSCGDELIHWIGY